MVPGQAAGSHKELHKTVVLLNVSLENLLTWAQDSFESRSVEFDTLEGTLCLHSGRSRSLQQQSNLP